MRNKGTYESVIAHIYRMFATALSGKQAELDSEGRIRMDSWELVPEVQNECQRLWQEVTTDNLKSISDYDDYKRQFLQLFGFELKEVDYSKDVNPDVAIAELEDLTAAR